jgi:hypothetical protein
MTSSWRWRSQPTADSQDRNPNRTTLSVPREGLRALGPGRAQGDHSCGPRPRASSTRPAAPLVSGLCRPGGSNGSRNLLEIQAESFCFRLEPQRRVETMSAVSGVALVRQKLDFVAPCGSRVTEEPMHDRSGDALAAMAGRNHDRFHKRGRSTLVCHVRHRHQRRRSNGLASRRRC